MKSLKEKIEVMQAALDGKGIKYKHKNSSDGFDLRKCVDDYNFNWSEYDYYIKPEPMEFWVNVYEEQNVRLSSLCESRKEAEARANGSDGHIKTIKLREVLDD